MRIAEFDYALPPERIAQEPPTRRGDSRLMIVDRKHGCWTHTEFLHLPEWLQPGDLLVRNVARVIPARLRGRRESGGEVEVLLVRWESGGSGSETWSCLARPGRRLHPGSRVRLCGGIEGTWLDGPDEYGLRRIQLASARPVLEVLETAGEVPLPPYIDRPPTEADRTAYQTIYAQRSGAIAAPTAGLHFTQEILQRIAAAGVEIRDLTLHVGPATFLPVRQEIVERHVLPPEEIEVPEETAEAVRRAKRERRRVIAVGTTTVRALEGSFSDGLDQPPPRWVSMFLYPGYRFRVVDALVTNFHLPRSTLLMLVAAFAGHDFILQAYREAVTRGYRFFSYGDAMFIV